MQSEFEKLFEDFFNIIKDNSSWELEEINVVVKKKSIDSVVCLKMILSTLNINKGWKEFIEISYENKIFSIKTTEDVPENLNIILSSLKEVFVKYKIN